MKRENDEITDLFRSRLGNAEMTVRDGFWEELNSEVMVRCHRRKVFFFRVAAGASLPAGVGGFFSPGSRQPLPYCWCWLLHRLLFGSSLRKKR